MLFFRDGYLYRCVGKFVQSDGTEVKGSVPLGGTICKWLRNWYICSMGKLKKEGGRVPLTPKVYRVDEDGGEVAVERYEAVHGGKYGVLFMSGVDAMNGMGIGEHRLWVYVMKNTVPHSNLVVLERKEVVGVMHGVGVMYAGIRGLVERGFIVPCVKGRYSMFMVNPLYFFKGRMRGGAYSMAVAKYYDYVDSQK